MAAIEQGNLRAAIPRLAFALSEAQACESFGPYWTRRMSVALRRQRSHVRIVSGAPLGYSAGLAGVCGFKRDVSQPRRGGPQPKISKTTPCKVAGCRRQGRLGQHLTRRANQRHSFTIARSIKRPWPRNSAPRCDFGQNPYPQLKLHWFACSDNALIRRA